MQPSQSTDAAPITCGCTGIGPGGQGRIWGAPATGSPAKTNDPSTFPPGSDRHKAWGMGRVVQKLCSLSRQTYRLWGSFRFSACHRPTQRQMLRQFGGAVSRLRQRRIGQGWQDEHHPSPPNRTSRSPASGSPVRGNSARQTLSPRALCQTPQPLRHKPPLRPPRAVGLT